LLPARLDREYRLTGGTFSPISANDHADGAIDWRTQDGLGQMPLNLDTK
jgi:hypothetical protein